MRTYPALPVTPLSIGVTTTKYGTTDGFLMWGNPTGFTSTAWTSGLAIFCPINLPWRYTVKSVWWSNGSGTINGAVDVGIYTPSFSKIFSSGAITQATINVAQNVDISPSVTLEPGPYYLAFTTNSSTGTYFCEAPGTAILRVAGILQQTGQTTLPGTATPTAPATNKMPCFGISKMPASF